MIKDFSIVDKNGLSYETTWNNDNVKVKETLKNRENPETKRLIKLVSQEYNVGIKWVYEDKEIVLINNDVIFGCPSIDMQYVIAIYSGDQAEFTPPNNAVIYNADGSIHKVLSVPLLISDAAKNQGWYKRQPDTTIGFTGVDWKTNSKGEKVVVIEISDHYYRIMKEFRVLNPETGEFGECIGSRIEYK